LEEKYNEDKNILSLENAKLSNKIKNCDSEYNKELNKLSTGNNAMLKKIKMLKNDLQLSKEKHEIKKDYINKLTTLEMSNKKINNELIK
jgi:hypothetical protein